MGKGIKDDAQVSDLDTMWTVLRRTEDGRVHVGTGGSNSSVLHILSVRALFREGPSKQTDLFAR